LDGEAVLAAGALLDDVAAVNQTDVALIPAAVKLHEVRELPEAPLLPLDCRALWGLGALPLAGVGLVVVVEVACLADARPRQAVELLNPHGAPQIPRRVVGHVGLQGDVEHVLIVVAHRLVQRERIGLEAAAPAPLLARRAGAVLPEAAAHAACVVGCAGGLGDRALQAGEYGLSLAPLVLKHEPIDGPEVAPRVGGHRRVIGLDGVAGAAAHPAVPVFVALGRDHGA